MRCRCRPPAPSAPSHTTGGARTSPDPPAAARRPPRCRGRADGRHHRRRGRAHDNAGDA
jgi:hypothetical protein